MTRKAVEWIKAATSTAVSPATVFDEINREIFAGEESLTEKLQPGERLNSLTARLERIGAAGRGVNPLRAANWSGKVGQTGLLVRPAHESKIFRQQTIDCRSQT